MSSIYLPESYETHPNFWLTIDVERLEDANFGVKPKGKLSIDYGEIIERWIDLNEVLGVRSCAFVLGSFAKAYPHLIRRLAQAKIEIALHGLSHQLVSTIPFTQWIEETRIAKAILEDLTGQEVVGYRSPSWSLPFQKLYYEALVELGVRYSSSYFPFKTYMYGHPIDKKRPFTITTPSGPITEIPVPKYLIPFSGGFYLRLLPTPLAILLARKVTRMGVKPIIYTHPYELLENLFRRFFGRVELDRAYLLAFANTGDGWRKVERLVASLKGENG
ncbi:MAG: DUF3473 domain-containing protein [Epsilonproteobacteria bacterium]|nr:DUF3473 domain-containing protein [Campylobacterota bacterium]